LYRPKPPLIAVDPCISFVHGSRHSFGGPWGLFPPPPFPGSLFFVSGSFSPLAKWFFVLPPVSRCPSGVISLIRPSQATDISSFFLSLFAPPSVVMETWETPCSQGGFRSQLKPLMETGSRSCFFSPLSPDLIYTTIIRPRPPLF